MVNPTEVKKKSLATHVVIEKFVVEGQPVGHKQNIGLVCGMDTPLRISGNQTF